MLFYQRRKLDSAEYSGSSSNSGDHWVSKIAVPPSVSNSASARASAATLNTDEKRDVPKLDESTGQNREKVYLKKTPHFLI